MNKIAIAKAIVANVTGYSIGTAAAVFLSNNRRHSENVVVETAIDASTVVTGFALGAVVHAPVRNYTDAKIDAVAAWYNENFKK